MKKIIPLTDLKLNRTAIISDILCCGNIRRRLLDLGIIPSTLITPIFKSTGGDPIAYDIRGTVLAIRKEDAEKIYVFF